MTQLRLIGPCLALLGAVGLAWGPAAQASPALATAGNLAITELLYFPPLPTAAELAAGFLDQNDFEFIELLNIGNEVISLEGVTFTTGIEFRFSGTLEPGALTVVVRNLAAFRFRYGISIPLAGQYSSRLANEGEFIQLNDALGQPLRAFQYLTGGGWPPILLNNPGGYSIELINPQFNPDPANPLNWRASVDPMGTPGRSSDSDVDGMLDSWELQYFGDLSAGPGEDPDADGLSNLEEYSKGTHPKNADTDQDGLSDKVESNSRVYVGPSDTGTDPLQNDTDLDGLKDGVETNTGVFSSLLDTGTDPLHWDTDRDSYGDGTELAAGKDPLDSASFPVAATIALFEASPLELIVGESITFTWETANADGVYLEPGGGAVANPSGQVTLTPAEPGFITYFLTASNGYWSAERSVRVRVFPDTPPTIYEFFATPAEVGRGGQAMLQWSLDGIVEEVSIDHGVGPVTGTSVIVSPSGAQAMIPKASVWRYLDDGSNQGAAWTGLDFDDSTWVSGPGPLGYGNSGLATIVQFVDQGGGGRNITTYFRNKFVAHEVASLAGLRLRVMRDDGVQIFLNGVEIIRDLLPEGPIDYETLAANALDDGQIYNEFLLDPRMLREGINVLAVGLHQASPVSADIQFDLELLGEPKADQAVTYTLTAGNGKGQSTAQATVTVRQSVEELVSLFDTWSFEESGTTLDPSWKDPGYADFAWSSGPGVMGVEDSGPAAPLMRTPLRLPTSIETARTYLRGRFNLPVPPSQVRSLSLTHLADDGAYVYLNGQEVHRIGVDPLYPLATRVMGNIDFEGPFALPVSALVQGENVLAVELYQPYITTTDIVWGSRLDAEFPLAPPGPALSISRLADGTVRVEWEADGYDLQAAGQPDGSWETLATTGKVYDIPSPGAPGFYRLRRAGF